MMKFEENEEFVCYFDINLALNYQNLLVGARFLQVG